MSNQPKGADTAPARIFLQVCTEDDCGEHFDWHEGVTWCQDRINDTDVEYVRAAPESTGTSEPTDAMIDAYLQANDRYWRETDELPTRPDKWRTGNVREATRVSLRAALAAPEGTSGAVVKEPSEEKK